MDTEKEIETIKVGDKISVLRKHVNPQDLSHVGDVLEVVVVDAPLVVVRQIDNALYSFRMGDDCQNFSLNLNHYDWKFLKQDFVDAMNCDSQQLGGNSNG